jgi:hypothetical protein
VGIKQYTRFDAIFVAEFPATVLPVVVTASGPQKYGVGSQIVDRKMFARFDSCESVDDI